MQLTLDPFARAISAASLERAGPDWATIVTAVATAVLAGVTLALVAYTKRLADVTSRPVVIVTLEPSPVTNLYFYMRLSNEGTASAHDIRVKFSPNLVPEKSAKWTNNPFPEVSLLRMGQVIEAIASSYAAISQLTFAVEVSWKQSPSSARRIPDIDVRL